MQKVLLHCLRMSLLALLLAGCASPQAQTQETGAQPPFKPVASVLDIMESLIAHMADDIFRSVGTIIDETGTHEIVPENDEAWLELKYAAMGLAETGNLLMFQSRAVDQDEWIRWSQELVDRSVVAAKAAEAKDPVALLDAGGQIYEACRGCHMVYVPQDPE